MIRRSRITDRLDGDGAGCHDSILSGRPVGGEVFSLDIPFHRTTPSAPSKDASLFFDARPPLLSQEGTTTHPELKLDTTDLEQPPKRQLHAEPDPWLGSAALVALPKLARERSPSRTCYSEIARFVRLNALKLSPITSTLKRSLSSNRRLTRISSEAEPKPVPVFRLYLQAALRWSEWFVLR